MLSIVAHQPVIEGATGVVLSNSILIGKHAKLDTAEVLVISSIALMRASIVLVLAFEDAGRENELLGLAVAISYG